MTWRRRLRRRLLWTGVLLGLVLLLVVVSALRVCAWGRDLLTDNASRTRRALERKEGTMIRTPTLVVGIAIAVLAIAPMALGKGQLAPLSAPSQVTTYRDAGDATAAQASLLHLAPLATYRDAGDATGARASLLHLANAAGTLDVAAVGKTRATNRPAGSGGHTDIDWKQVGVGIAIGIGMALAIGLGLAVQGKRARPLPH